MRPTTPVVFLTGVVLGVCATLGAMHLLTAESFPEQTGAAGISINIPPAGDENEITAPKENELIKSPLIVAGNAAAFENQFAVSLHDANGMELSRVPAYAHGEGDKPGPFVELLGFSELQGDTGTVEIWEQDPATGARTVLDAVTVRFR